MAMIIPERTVDAWTATYITGRRWRARLWAPTERAPDEGYDLGAGLGKVGGMPGHVDPEPWPDKVFVLEHKGADEHRTKGPVAWIRLRQLLTHLAADRARGGRLVYYVLPDVDWAKPKRAPYGTVPSVAARRTKGLTWDGFQLWACVVHVEDLLWMLASIYFAEPGRFLYRAPSGSRKDDWYCPITMAELWLIPGRLPLRDFISGVRDCTHGRLVTDPGLSGGGSPAAFGPRDSIGPSGGDLASALGIRPPDDEDRDARIGNVTSGSDDVLDVLDRPGAATFFGIGDSDEDSRRAPDDDPGEAGWPDDELERLTD